MRYLKQYSIMAALLLLAQVGLFSNFSFGLYLAPLPYVALIIMLPINMSRLLQLLIALATGVVIDLFVGYSSINTIATLAVGFARAYILSSMSIKDGIESGGIPSAERLGKGNYRALIFWLVTLHNLIYFSFESLSVINWQLTLERFGCSTLFSLLFVSLAGRLLNTYTSKK